MKDLSDMTQVLPQGVLQLVIVVELELKACALALTAKSASVLPPFV